MLNLCFLPKSRVAVDSFFSVLCAAGMNSFLDLGAQDVLGGFMHLQLHRGLLVAT